MEVAYLRVVTPPGLDTERGVCVGRLEWKVRYGYNWYSGAFDWAGDDFPNPPTDYRAGLPWKDRCCTLWKHLPDGQTVCWRDAPDR